MRCYRHPNAPATASCFACQEPVCTACRGEVAGYAICPACAAEQKCLQREERETERDFSTEWDGDPTPPPAAPPTPCGTAQYAKAALLAGIGALVGAVIWDKIALWTGWRLGLPAVALGWLVGVAVPTGAARQPGRLLPWLGAVMAAFAILLGYSLLGLADLARERPDVARELGELPFLIRLPFVMMVTVTTLSVLDWVFLVLGVREGWSIPRRLNREAESKVASPASDTRPQPAGAEPVPATDTADRPARPVAPAPATFAAPLPEAVEPEPAPASVSPPPPPDSDNVA